MALQVEYLMASVYHADTKFLTGYQDRRDMPTSQGKYMLHTMWLKETNVKTTTIRNKLNNKTSRQLVSVQHEGISQLEKYLYIHVNKHPKKCGKFNMKF